MIHRCKCIKVHYLYGVGTYYDSQVQMYKSALFVWGGGIYYDPRCKCIKVH